MSKILVIGSSECSNALIAALINHYGDGAIDSTQNEPLTKAQMPDQYWGMGRPRPDNNWRGGSKGKGGKTKWPRR